MRSTLTTFYSIPTSIFRLRPSTVRLHWWPRTGSRQQLLVGAEEWSSNDDPVRITSSQLNNSCIHQNLSLQHNSSIFLHQTAKYLKDGGDRKMIYFDRLILLTFSSTSSSSPPASPTLGRSRESIMAEGTDEGVEIGSTGGWEGCSLCKRLWVCCSDSQGWTNEWLKKN